MGAIFDASLGAEVALTEPNYNRDDPRYWDERAQYLAAGLPPLPQARTLLLQIVDVATADQVPLTDAQVLEVAICAIRKAVDKKRPLHSFSCISLVHSEGLIQRIAAGRQEEA